MRLNQLLLSVKMDKYCIIQYGSSSQPKQRKKLFPKFGSLCFSCLTSLSVYLVGLQDHLIIALELALHTLCAQNIIFRSMHSSHARFNVCHEKKDVIFSDARNGDLPDVSCKKKLIPSTPPMTIRFQVVEMFRKRRLYLLRF